MKRVDDRQAMDIGLEVTRAVLPTQRAEFDIYAVRDPETGDEAVVVGKAIDRPGEVPAVRIHSQCLTGDVFGSARCDCGSQLDRALARIEREGRGMVIYLFQEGRGIGIVNKIRAYALQDRGADTVDANVALGLPIDDRTYDLAAKILKHFGITNIRLITNNPKKIDAMQAAGINVADRLPATSEPSVASAGYLSTKRSRMGHLLEM